MITDIADLFAPPPAPPSQDWRYRQGLIVSWNPATAENQVLIGDALFTNLSVLNTSEALLLEAGDTVAIAVIGSGLTTMAILGRLTIPGTPEAASALTAISTATDEIQNSETTASTSYTDLTTPGPTVTLRVGRSGRLLVLVSAVINAASVKNQTISTGSGYMGFEMTGTQTLAPTDGEAASALISYDSSPSASGFSVTAQVSATRVVPVDGITPGLVTITGKYRSGATGTATFSNRTITAIAL